MLYIERNPRAVVPSQEWRAPSFLEPLRRDLDKNAVEYARESGRARGPKFFAEREFGTGVAAICEPQNLCFPIRSPAARRSDRPAGPIARTYMGRSPRGSRALMRCSAGTSCDNDN